MLHQDSGTASVQSSTVLQNMEENAWGPGSQCHPVMHRGCLGRALQIKSPYPVRRSRVWRPGARMRVAPCLFVSDWI